MAANVPIFLSQILPTTVRDPNGVVAVSSLVPVTTFSEKLADVVGNYSGFTSGIRPLNAATTVGVSPTALGTLVSLVIMGADLYPLVLAAGTNATNVPLTVQPADYNGVTNQVVYNLMNWHARALLVEGISGAGYVGLPAQAVYPATPLSSLQTFANGTYAMVVAGPSGSVVIPTSGYASNYFLRRDGVWAAAPSSAYVPSTPSAWSGSPPTTIQQALDRLAAVAPSKP